MRFWPFISKRKYRELQLICIDRGSRLIDAQHLIATQAQELHRLKMVLAGRSGVIRKAFVNGSEVLRP